MPQLRSPLDANLDGNLPENPKRDRSVESHVSKIAKRGT